MFVVQLYTCLRTHTVIYNLEGEKKEDILRNVILWASILNFRSQTCRKIVLGAPKLSKRHVHPVDRKMHVLNRLRPYKVTSYSIEMSFKKKKKAGEEGVPV